MPIFSAVANFTPGAAVNIGLEVAAAAGHPIEILEIGISQESDTTTGALAVTANYATAAATGWTTSTITPKDLDDNNNATANATVKAYSSGTSTDGTGTVVRDRWGLNALSVVPLVLLDPDQAHFKVAAGHFFTLKFAVAPPASTPFNLVVKFLER